MAKNYYDILGIEKNASKEDIKKAFRNLAHKFHPDKKGGDEKKFKEVSEAYSVLSDEKKRAEYDAYGQTFQGGAGAGGFNPQDFANAGFDFSNFAQGFSGENSSAFGTEFDLGDIFGDIFGGGRARSSRRATRGRDISIDVELSFAEAVFGVERRILLNKTSVCHDCKGSGAKRGTDMTECSVCNGKGKIRETKRSFIGNFTTVRVCDRCDGRGKVPKEKCPACGGGGVLRREQEITVTIPPGIDDGEMIRLGGAGEAVAEGVPGDLYIKVHVKKHQLFRKEGSNLVTDLTIKLSSALLGEEYTIETLDGEIKLKIPEGVSIGEILRVKGKGVPYEKGKRGDLLVRLNIKLPAKLSRDARKMVEELKREGI